MYRGSNPRILPVFIIIVVVALVIAALVTVGRMVFSGGSGDQPAAPKDTVSSAVLETDLSRSVRWTVRGPIVASENFRSYQITVSANTRTYVVYSGYLDQATETKTYDNSPAAYEQFVYALNLANIGDANKAADTDIRGVCATDGLAFTFETLKDGNPDNTLWSSTCKDSKGTMAADALQIQALFTNQIPDFKPLFSQVY
ncbi:MAG: hypothetical protein ABI397_03085 [Candidatus Saccharimonas sp.]